MIPQEREIVELVDMVWSTTLDMETHLCDPIERDRRPLPAVEAQVHITGSWQGVVALHTSQELAARIARRMFHLHATAPTSEDVQDAFGEMANITGGNIKGLLSESNAHLSLPAVVQGMHYSVRVPGSHEIGRFEFLCEGEPLVVTIIQANGAVRRDDESGASAAVRDRAAAQ